MIYMVFYFLFRKKIVVDKLFEPNRICISEKGKYTIYLHSTWAKVETLFPIELFTLELKSLMEKKKIPVSFKINGLRTRSMNVGFAEFEADAGEYLITYGSSCKYSISGRRLIIQKSMPFFVPTLIFIGIVIFLHLLFKILQIDLCSLINGG